MKKLIEIRSFVFQVALIAGLGFYSTGCSSDDDNKMGEDITDNDTSDIVEGDSTEEDVVDDTTEPKDKTWIRVLHLSPDAPAVDILANGGATPAVSDLAFPDGTGYLELDAGEYTFDIVPAGGVLADSVLNIPVTLAGDTYYTAVAIDEVSSLTALALVDDYSELAADTIRIRAIHAAPAVGEVDIWNIPAEGAPSALYENVGFGVAGGYLDVPAGAYTLGFDVDNDANPDVIFKTPALAAGTVANVFAVNDDMGKVFLRVQFEEGSLATIEPEPAVEPVAKTWIRVLHLSPDAPAVDILANGGATPAVSDLAFPDGTGYLELDAGEYTFDIVPSGGVLADSVLNIPVTLAGDTYYTAVAIDEVASLTALALVDDYSDLADDTIRIRAIHAAPGVGEVDIWNIPAEGAPSALYENVGFGVAGGYLDVPAGAYKIGFDINNDASPDVIFDIPALPAGTVANVFAANDDVGNVFLRAQLNDGTLVTINPTP